MQFYAFSLELFPKNVFKFLSYCVNEHVHHTLTPLSISSYRLYCLEIRTVKVHSHSCSKKSLIWLNVWQRYKPWLDQTQLIIGICVRTVGIAFDWLVVKLGMVRA